jgi:DNA-binding NarL/FixJ family response regulator
LTSAKNTFQSIILLTCFEKKETSDLRKSMDFLSKPTGRKPQRNPMRINDNRVKVTPKIHAKILDLQAKGWSKKSIGEELGLSKATVIKYTKEAK